MSEADIPAVSGEKNARNPLRIPRSALSRFSFLSTSGRTVARRSAWLYLGAATDVLFHSAELDQRVRDHFSLELHQLGIVFHEGVVFADRETASSRRELERAMHGAFTVRRRVALAHQLLCLSQDSNDLG